MNSTSRPTKVAIALFLLLLLLSIAATYYNTMIVRDFVIINDIEEEEL